MRCQWLLITETLQPYNMTPERLPHPNFSIIDFRQGQSRAFTYVFEHYYPALRFFATRLTQNPPAAEDIAQETFIKLWEKHTGFHTQAIKAFLYITTRNACFNFMKREQADAKNHRDWSRAWNESEDYVLNQVTRSEVMREVYVILEMLPPECRKIMRHSFIEGRSNREIATLLNISIHTVKNQKARAIYLIRKKLGNRSLFLITMALLEMAGAEARLSSPTTITTPSRFQSVTSSLPKTTQAVHKTLLKCASYTISLFNFFLFL
jgi:RNA polymerase sigma-70 factor (family 1)